MRPYIDFNGERLYLPQRVDAHNFEVCSRNHGNNTFFLLCKKVSQRYRQVTGVVLERKKNDLDFHLAGSRYVQRTFPLDGSELNKINIDWSASSGPITIKHEEG